MEDKPVVGGSGVHANAAYRNQNIVPHPCIFPYFFDLQQQQYAQQQQQQQALTPSRGDEMSTNSLVQDRDLPKFAVPPQNITIPVGREAILTCVVDNLQTYKIAWLRVDTQTILTIQNHVITKNHRMTIQHAEKRAWILKIKDVKESDMGWYMCQINTDPMKMQTAYLDVVVPPDILDYPTSTDMVIQEGKNVTLKCAATGSPTPTITWRREGSDPITINNGVEASSYNGSIFTIPRVDRINMGAYLCIASNGIPPTVSKRVMLIVHFPPMIWIQNQLVGAAIGQDITLECQSEAFPRSINYWMKNDTIIMKNDRFLTTEIPDNAYKIIMKLTIFNVEIKDFGVYKCVAKNSLGETDGAIKLYHIPHSTVSTLAPTEPPAPTVSLNQKHDILKADKTQLHKSSNIDLHSISLNNNVLVGATSAAGWNVESLAGHERGGAMERKNNYDGNIGDSISGITDNPTSNNIDNNNNELSDELTNYLGSYATTIYTIPHNIIPTKNPIQLATFIILLFVFLCSLVQNV